MIEYAMSLDERPGAGGLPWLRRLLPPFLSGGARISPRDFPGFDAEAYLRENPDVAASGIPALAHFAKEGWMEGRRLSPRLDARQYLTANAHVRHVLLDIQRRRGALPPAVRGDERLRPGILLVGYVEAGLGLGESSRGLARALAQAGLPFAIHPYNLAVEDRFVGPFMPERYDKAGRYEVTLFEANGDHLDAFLEQFGRRAQGSHRIFRTYWELAEAPRAWAPRLARFDEVWAPTRFVAEAFRHVFDGPITVVPPAVSVESAAAFGRAYFGLPAERFLFLFTFDYNSIVARKNPAGLAEAFRAAFPAPDDGVGLVLKSIGPPSLCPASRAALLRAAREDPRIVVLEETLSRDEILSLARVCDGYASLHRSEGFGFGMAEALGLGRPVMGTDYSGCTDFLDEETGFPVPCRLRPLRDGEYPYGDGQSWAEPDLAAATAILRRVREDRAGREARAEAGRRRMEERFGARAVGRIAAERLRSLLAEREGRNPPG